ncbi:unnamed protein product [Victoria cruziana]
MVKTVTGEESQLTAFETQLSQSGASVQVGLAVGKLNDDLDRGYVFGLIPTPPNDHGQPACTLLEGGANKRKPSKGKPPKDSAPSLEIDVGWVAEHARQVSKVLLGSVRVVGIYIWAGESSFKQSSVQLWQTVSAVSAASPSHDYNPIERILIHISYSPRRWSCRNCILSSTFSSTSFRPCDFKMGKVSSGLQAFSCVYNFEMRIPVYEDASNQKTFKDAIHKGITLHATILKDAEALVDGNLVYDSQTCSSDSMHEVELLLPFMSDRLTEACSGSDIAGLLVFSGSIYATTYLSPKESIGQAISDIKADIITSLRSRLDIVSDEAEQMMPVDSGDSTRIEYDSSNAKPAHPLLSFDLRKPFSFSFPRRVLLPWFGGIFVSDYLQPFEEFKDAKERCKELMSMDVSETEFLEPETAATAPVAKSFGDVVLDRSRSTPNQGKGDKKVQWAEESNSTESKFFPWSMVIAGFFLLLSVVIGVWMLSLSKDHKSQAI